MPRVTAGEPPELLEPDAFRDAVATWLKDDMRRVADAAREALKDKPVGHIVCIQRDFVLPDGTRSIGEPEYFMKTDEF